MKQLLQNLRSGETHVAEVPIPTAQPGEVLVQNAASLVSAGTERMVVEFAEKSLLGKARSRPDLVRQVLDKARREGLLTTIEAAFTKLDQPMPLGYSSAGWVVALGEGVQGLSSGQRVACAGGGYAVHAEYVVVPRQLVTPLPDEVDFESAAFTTLGAVALHGFRLAEPQVGEKVAVIGLGLLGLLAAGIAQAAGCQVLGIDLDPSRIELAGRMGVQAVQRAAAEEAAHTFSRGRGCDAVLICADTPSSDPVMLAGLIARDRARVVAVGAVGLHIPRKLYFEKELTFINSRSYGPGRYDPSYEEGGHDYPVGYVRWTEGRNLEAFVDLLAARQVRVAPLITHRFPIEDANLAYQLITGKRQEPFLGVLLTYPPTLTVEAGREVGREAGREAGRPASHPEPARAAPARPARDGRNDPIVRLGVLGAGNFASAVMLPVLKKTAGVELVGIASASGLNAQHASRRFGFRYAASDPEQLLNDPDINTVAILTRHNLHARQVVAALAAGKNVFCEKPLAIQESELEEIRAVLDSGAGQPQGSQLAGSSLQPSAGRLIAGRLIAGQLSAGRLSAGLQSAGLLTVGFNRRFAPLAQRMFDFFSGRQEPLVISYRVNAGYIPLNHWLHDPAIGGGRIIGEGCHFIDFLTFLAGASPQSVSARGLPDAGRYREDNVVMSFQFPDGTLGTVSYLANGDKAFPKERIEVFAAGRVAVLDDFRSLELVGDGRRQTLHARLRQDKGHQAEWNAFVSAITSGGPPTIPYAHLFGVTEATFAAVRALHTGESVPIAPLRQV